MAWHPNGKWLAIGYFNHDFVEVWDIQTKQSVLKVPSTRRPISDSGQELIFSPDGKYLVVQDLVNTKPEYERAKKDDDPSELAAQKDTQRLILARVWDLERKKEVSQLRGAGSRFHAGNLRGMCFEFGQPNKITILRKSILSIYAVPSGQHLSDISARNPYSEKPDKTQDYDAMTCHPSQRHIALQTPGFLKAAPIFGYPVGSAATPLIVLDTQKKKVIKVLISPTWIRSVQYNADGNQFSSEGNGLLRLWDTQNNYGDLGEITMPNMKFLPTPTPIANFKGLLTFGNGVQIWDTQKKSLAYSSKLPPTDLFRVAVHQPSGLYAMPIYPSTVSFFKLDSKKLVQLTQ
jgi:WD40 repeat protein